MFFKREFFIVLLLVSLLTGVGGAKESATWEETMSWIQEKLPTWTSSAYLGNTEMVDDGEGHSLMVTSEWSIGSFTKNGIVSVQSQTKTKYTKRTTRWNQGQRTSDLYPIQTEENFTDLDFRWDLRELKEVYIVTLPNEDSSPVFGLQLTFVNSQTGQMRQRRTHEYYNLIGLSYTPDRSSSDSDKAESWSKLAYGLSNGFAEGEPIRARASHGGRFQYNEAMLVETLEQAQRLKRAFLHAAAVSKKNEPF